jgi:hypothetical protein
MTLAPALQTIINKEQAEYVFGKLDTSYMQYQVILIPTTLTSEDPFSEDIAVNEPLEDVLAFIKK